MGRRQTITAQWLIVDSALDEAGKHALRRLPRGSGVLVIAKLGAGDRRHLRRLAALRSLVVVTEGRNGAARVHDLRELRAALLRRTPMILLSPMFETRSHPGWRPLPRMRAAALARLVRREAVALGGMDARRYARIAPLGFIGWAGISAFRT